MPFELIPFKVGDVAVVPPKPPPNHIYAVEEKHRFEISFPLVKGYQASGAAHAEVDWERVPMLDIDPMLVPDSVEVRGLATEDGRLAAFGPGIPQTLTLKDWRNSIRARQVAFLLAGDLCRRWVEQQGDTIPPHVLFPRLLRYTERFLREKVNCHGDTQIVDVLIGIYYRAALDYLFNAMAADESASQQERPIIPRGAAGTRSTSQVDFHTRRDLSAAQKCHLNALVADTKTWEQAAAFTLDQHPGVSSWVKNDHLGFEIPYHRDHAPRQYRPDFIVRLTNELNLILEIKGRMLEDAKIKRAAAIRWINTLNRDPEYGQWEYKMVFEPAGTDQDAGCTVRRLQAAGGFVGFSIFLSRI